MAPKKKAPWFRMYVEAVSDPKLRRRKVEHRWLWVCVLAAARASAVPGVLYIEDDEPWTEADLADYAAIPLAVVRAGMASFVKAEMLTEDDGVWKVTRWDARQYESDTSTERVRRHRERNATPMERSKPVPKAVSGTPQRTEAEAEAEPSDDSTEIQPVERTASAIVVGDQVVNRALLAYSRIVTDRTPGVVSFDAFAAGVRRDAIAEGVNDDLRRLLEAGMDIDAAAAERAGRTDPPRAAPAADSAHPLLRSVPAWCGSCEDGWIFTDTSDVARCPTCNPNPIGAVS